MVFYQSSLEDDGAVDVLPKVGAVRKKSYPAHQDPKKITLEGQPTDVKERGLDKLHTGIAQEVGAQFNKLYGRGWRRSSDAAALQTAFTDQTSALYELRMKQLTRGGK